MPVAVKLPLVRRPARAVVVQFRIGDVSPAQWDQEVLQWALRECEIGDSY